LGRAVFRALANSDRVFLLMCLLLALALVAAAGAASGFSVPWALDLAAGAAVAGLALRAVYGADGAGDGGKEPRPGVPASEGLPSGAAGEESTSQGAATRPAAERQQRRVEQRPRRSSTWLAAAAAAAAAVLVVLAAAAAAAAAARWLPASAQQQRAGWPQEPQALQQLLPALLEGYSWRRLCALVLAAPALLLAHREPRPGRAAAALASLLVLALLAAAGALTSAHQAWVLAMLAWWHLCSAGRHPYWLQSIVMLDLATALLSALSSGQAALPLVLTELALLGSGNALLGCLAPARQAP
jgi:hypothetical protein